jgi:hypothetical protein
MFSFVFILVLSIIIIFGSVLIWKSDFPEADKVKSIIIIICLFSAVLIINEAKHSNIISFSLLKHTGEDAEKLFT